MPLREIEERVEDGGFGAVEAGGAEGVENEGAEDGAVQGVRLGGHGCWGGGWSEMHVAVGLACEARNVSVEGRMFAFQRYFMASAACGISMSEGVSASG